MNRLLPSGWTLQADGFLVDASGYPRFVRNDKGRIDAFRVSAILSNNGHEAHATAWGSPMAGELFEAAQYAAGLLAKIPAFGDGIGTEVSKAQLGVALHRLNRVLGGVAS